MIDPSLLPPVCPSCGDVGRRKEVLYFRDPVPWSLWLTLGVVFVGLPLLLSLGALLIWIFWGADAVDNYSKRAIPIMAAVAGVAGLWTARSAFKRSKWGLTFYFCEQCAQKYHTLKKGLTVIGTLTAVSFLIWPSLALLVLLTGGGIVLNWLGLFILVSFPIFLAGSITIYTVMRRTRGIKARWVSAQSALEIEFRDQHIFDLISKRMNSATLAADAKQMDETEFEAELNRLVALAESYEAKMYEAHDQTTAAAHYSNMKDYFHEAIGLARRAGRNDHIERLEKRLNELKQIFRDQLSF